MLEIRNLFVCLAVFYKLRGQRGIPLPQNYLKKKDARSPELI